MSCIQVTLIEGAFTPTDKAEIDTSPSWAWGDIEDVLSDKWEVGAPAMTNRRDPCLVADE